jgi:RimJ/RimL family protein N-acetyltransferase
MKLDHLRLGSSFTRYNRFRRFNAMSSHLSDILTSRLALIAITPDSILAEQSAAGNYRRFGEVIGCTIHREWPPIHWEPHVFDFFLKQFSEHPNQVGWNRYVALPQPDGTRILIGSLGAFSKTDSATCEIGYGILPSFESQGFATEGTRALIDFLRSGGRVASIIAHTFPSLPRSIRVMEKCGLTLDGQGEEAGTVRYRLNLR